MVTLVEALDVGKVKPAKGLGRAAGVAGGATGVVVEPKLKGFAWLEASGIEGLSLAPKRSGIDSFCGESPERLGGEAGPFDVDRAGVDVEAGVGAGVDGPPENEKPAKGLGAVERGAPDAADAPNAPLPPNMLEEGAGAPKRGVEDVEAGAPKRGVEPKDGAVEEAAPKEKDGAAVERPPNKPGGMVPVGGGYVGQPEGSVGG